LGGLGGLPAAARSLNPHAQHTGFLRGGVHYPGGQVTQTGISPLPSLGTSAGSYAVLDKLALMGGAPSATGVDPHAQLTGFIRNGVHHPGGQVGHTPPVLPQPTGKVGFDSGFRDNVPGGNLSGIFNPSSGSRPNIRLDPRAAHRAAMAQAEAEGPMALWKLLMGAGQANVGGGSPFDTLYGSRSGVTHDSEDPGSVAGGGQLSGSVFDSPGALAAAQEIAARAAEDEENPGMGYLGGLVSEPQTTTHSVSIDFAPTNHPSMRDPTTEPIGPGIIGSASPRPSQRQSDPSISERRTRHTGCARGTSALIRSTSRRRRTPRGLAPPP
jgi:hypothetical protein